MNNLRIGLDIDDVLAGFFDTYKRTFTKPKDMEDVNITRNVDKLKNNKHFWTTLPKINNIDFVPALYCTKRVNKKCWTKDWLAANHFPERPVYQMYFQRGNKATMIKGRVDVFIDDSISNFVKMNASGVPCLLMDAPHNQGFETPYRIYSLTLKEIKEKYNGFKQI